MTLSRRQWLAAAAALPLRAAEPAPTVVLGRPTASSVTVNVHYPKPRREVWVEFGPEPEALTRRTPPLAALIPGSLFEGVVEDLPPDARVFYRIVSLPESGLEPEATPVYSCHTQRSRGAGFVFTLTADSHLFTEKHCNPARYLQALANASQDQPDFHLDLGDTFRLDSVVRDPLALTWDTVLARSLAHRPFFHTLTHSAPLFLVPGNHDAEYAWYADPASGYHPSLPLWATEARTLVYPNPAPDNFYSGNTTRYEGIPGGLRENYYAWEWGDALFVVLDPYWLKTSKNTRDWGPIHGDEQYRWFRDTLRSSTARHKFVFEHHLHGEARGGVELAHLYEWGGRDQRGDWRFDEMRPGWDKPMHHLMAEAGVKIYFQGHDHLWAKGELDGVVYLTVPMPAASPTQFPFGDNDDAYPQSQILPNSGHLRVTVTPETVDVDYLTARLPEDEAPNRALATTFRL